MCIACYIMMSLAMKNRNCSWRKVEFTAMYRYTLDRTTSNVFPYENLTNGSRLALQVQINY